MVDHVAWENLGPYMIAYRRERSPGRKTDVWDVVNRNSDVVLARVEWHCPWRRYVLIPIAEDTIWAADCLRLIADFIERQMAARKRGQD